MSANLWGDYHSNWWGPNPECVYEMLGSIDWPHVLYQRHPVVGESRGIYHAYRSAEAAARSFKAPVDNVSVFDLTTEAGRNAIFGRPPPTAQADTPPAPDTSIPSRWRQRLDRWFR